MCNECAYCGTTFDPLRIDEDQQLTCQCCMGDDEVFFGLQTLDDWQEDRRDEAFDRADYLRDQRRDRFDVMHRDLAGIFANGIARAVIAANR